jgi:aspartate/methionine/tyrosine aminotransferase
LNVSRRASKIPEEAFFIALNLPPDVLRLTAGEPDFPSASFVLDAASKAMYNGETHYTAPAGIMSLRQEIARKLKSENNLSYDANEIVVAPGSSGAVGMVLLAMIDPGEEILIPDPAWFHYATLVELAGGVPKRVALSPKDGFTIHGSKIEEAASEKTKGLILNSPSNPMGRVFSKNELEEVAGAAERLSITVLSDEIYEKIIYPPHSHVSIGSLSGMQERTITVNGFSKGYACMGWRVGYAAAPLDVSKKLESLLGYSLVCAGSVSQYAALEALRNPKSKEYTKKMLEAWTRRREIVMRYVNESGSVLSARAPEGTFYGWIDVSGSGLDGKSAARLALEKAKVGVMPGYLFGELGGRNHVRISFATSDNIVEEGMRRLSSVLGANSKERNDQTNRGQTEKKIELTPVHNA